MLVQLIRLLSQPPGTLIYHLVTLFAVQAVLALAWWPWRRARQQGGRDAFAGRLMVTAGGLLLLRGLLLLVTALVVNRPDLLLPSQVLPPLEQAVNTISLILIIWALVLPPVQVPRLADGLALFLIILTGGIWLSFAQSWAAQALTSGPYNSSFQATFWGIYQIILLSGGLVWLYLHRPADAALRFCIMGVFWLAHVAHLWNYPELIPSGSDVPYWIRLGYLVGLPLLAVLAYRHNFQALLGSAIPPDTPASNAEKDSWLRAFLRLNHGQNPDEVAAAAVQLVAQMFPGESVLLVLLGEQEGPGPVWAANPAGDAPPAAPAQTLVLQEWASLRLALEQRQTLILHAEGRGTYQLQELTAALSTPRLVQMVIEPVFLADNPLGVLLVGYPTEPPPASSRTMLPLCAALCAETVSNAQAYQRALHDVAPLTATSEALISGRVMTLEVERDQALDQNQLLLDRVQAAESQYLAEQEQARRLAQELAILQEQHPAVEEAARLKEEMAILREALYEAEEAMSVIAAREGGVSADWVLLTISRYSAELEAAQMRIRELEAELARLEPGQMGRLLTSLLQELRTPLTSIEGYTDLLLAETAQIVDSQHRDFLQRVKANAGRMHMLLEQIVRVAVSAGQGRVEEKETPVDVRREVENAVSMVLSQMRKKKLVLNLDVADNLLPLALQRNDLCDIVVHLLNNACLASTGGGQMTLRVHMAGVVMNGNDSETARQHYYHIAVSDSSAGLLPEDLPRVFDPQYEADHPLIDGIGDTNAGLAVAEALVTAHGGRLWVESRRGKGNTFSVLLPVPAGNGEVAPAP